MRNGYVFTASDQDINSEIAKQEKIEIHHQVTKTIITIATTETI